MERNRERRVWVVSRARGCALVFIWESGGAHSHASDCADCAPSPPSFAPGHTSAPLHLCSWKWSGPCPAPRRHTRPRDLPALPLPPRIAAYASWNSGHSLDELVLDCSCVGCPPASPGALSPPTGRCDFTRIHLSPDSDGFPNVPCIRSTIQQVDITLPSQSHSMERTRQGSHSWLKDDHMARSSRTVTVD